MTRPKIGIIVGTTREGRFADHPLNWYLDLVKDRDDADFEVVDLRDYPMPFFEEPMSPAWATPANAVAQRWAEKMASLDGYIFTVAEYNHSISGVLKNALDYAYKEYNRKPASFLAYGGTGGVRATEQLRLILVELQIAPIRSAVHIGLTELLGIMREGKTMADFPYLIDGAKAMTDDLVWWTNALKTARAA